MRDAKKTPKMITLKNDRLSYGIVSIGMKLFFSQLYLKLVLGYIVLWPVKGKENSDVTINKLSLWKKNTGIYPFILSEHM